MSGRLLLYVGHFVAATLSERLDDATGASWDCKVSVESRILPTPSDIKRVPVRLDEWAALHRSKCVL